MSRRVHPWTKPALRSRDPKLRARVRALYQAHRELIADAYGEPSLGTLCGLASTLDMYELLCMQGAGCTEKQRARIARHVLDGFRHAHRLAQREHSWRRRAR